MTTKLIALIPGFWLISHVWAEPPSLLRLVRNVQSANAIQSYVDSRAAVNVLGMRAVSGPDEAWLIEMHDSFASLEGVDQALASARPLKDSSAVPDDLLPPARLLIAMYRPGLSYRPDEAVKSLPKARYLLISLYRMRPGDEAQFAQVVKPQRARSDSINLDRPELAYEVVAGAISGTYVFVAPFPTLKTLDDGLARTPAYAEGVRETGKKVAAGVEITLERMLFRMEPSLSYVSEEFAAGDPEFWNPKPK
jgi:hypothetical protein